MSLGNRLKFLRESAKLTREELASKLSVPVIDKGHVTGYRNITSLTLYNIETDKNRPSYDIVLGLSKFFQVSCDYLLKGDVGSCGTTTVSTLVKTYDTFLEEFKAFCKDPNIPDDRKESVLRIAISLFRNK